MVGRKNPKASTGSISEGGLVALKLASAYLKALDGENVRVKTPMGNIYIISEKEFNRLNGREDVSVQTKETEEKYVWNDIDDSINTP